MPYSERKFLEGIEERGRFPRVGPAMRPYGGWLQSIALWRCDYVISPNAVRLLMTARLCSDDEYLASCKGIIKYYVLVIMAT